MVTKDMTSIVLCTSLFFYKNFLKNKNNIVKNFNCNTYCM